MPSLKKIKWQHAVLAGIIILAFFLNFWALDKEGYSNQYYSAAVKSMLQNPSAFFFGSLDTGLYVTVDKPPLGLWIQALSAKVLGVNSFGLILPSALAGCLCALMMYIIVKKAWGPTPGVIAAGITATTPILVALSRTNNLDVLLMFFLLCGARFMLDAARKQSLPLYLVAMIFVGLGFNIKMLQAFLVAPAFLLVYFLGKGRLKKKLLHTAAAVCVLAAVSLSWAVAVDAIPASKRPYIGSSSTNSVIELAFGYNGISRLNGQRSGTGMSPLNMIRQDKNVYGFNGSRTDQASAAMPGGTDSAANPGPVRGASGPGGADESGTPGILRLYSAQLSGLVSWFLLPAAAVVLAVGAGGVYWFRRRRTLSITQEQRQKLMQAVFWSAWLVPMGVFFSFGGFIHRYYVAMLCPAIGALTAFAAVLAFGSRHRRWLVPACFVPVLAAQCLIVAGTAWLWVLIPMLAAGTAGIFLFSSGKKTARTAAAFLMAGSLFAAPIAWSFTPVFQTINATIPDAGPNADGGTVGSGGMRRGGKMEWGDSGLNEYLLAHFDGERWAIAVSNANEAAAIILETGLPVMAVGGFSGSDPILTLSALKEYVASGQLRYYRVLGIGGGNDEITGWVQENGSAVRLGNGETIYDLAPR